MPIRITGMYSGLDTESIIQELASAQSVKVNSIKKAQIKLSWKQDAWKALNTKIYSFYSNFLTNMTLESNYKKKVTKVSDESAVSVINSSDSVDGIQTLTNMKMAKSGYLTSGNLSDLNGGKKFKGSSKLSELGFSGSGSFDVTVGGRTTQIDVTADTRISDVVSKLQGAGVNASFDETNQRFFVSSKATGAAANFTVTGNNADGMNALSAMGLLSSEDLTNNAEYTKWADYATNTTAYNEAVAAEIEKRAAAYKAANAGLTKANEDLQKKIDEAKADSNYVAGKSASAFYDELYGTVTGQDGEGNDIRSGGLKADLDAAKKTLSEAQNELKELKKNDPDNAAAIAAAEQKITDATTGVTDAQKAFDDRNAQYQLAKTVEDSEAAITANNTTIADNQKYFTVGADDKAVGTADLKTKVEEDFRKKIQTALDVTSGIYGDKAKAKKVQGEDAEIELNGVKFKSNSNTFNINGLTINVLKETTGPVTLTTTDDTDGMYNMIKDFLKEYNSLINEMATLYNAESSKGYDPLLSEEKAALSDTEVEEWEKKIKSSLLRRDSTVGDISTAMRSIMIQGATVNGKQMYLSDFGINTLGYWEAAENEKGAYHIDGDPDDVNTKNATDVLKKMISSDPDTVVSFFTQLSKNMYADLQDKMKGTKLSSALTFYNDKQMKTEYDSYAEKITKQEEKLNDLMDKWYKKFSAMETAMAKLQSKNNAIAGMFGG